MAPVSRSTACSAVCARCVRPSFILAIFASGSCGWVQSAFEPFFLRVRSNRANSARVGVERPDASASRVQKCVVALARVPPHDAPHRRIGFQRRGIDADRAPHHQRSVGQSLQHPRNTAWWVSRSIRRRVRDSVEWSGGASWRAKSRNVRMLSESAARHAIARSESRPSK